MAMLNNQRGKQTNISSGHYMDMHPIRDDLDRMTIE